MILVKSSMLIAEEEGRSLLFEPGYVGIEQDKIVYIGETAPSGFEKATVIDVPRGVIIPGFINLHFHTDTPITKGFIEDVGSANFYGSILYEHLPAMYEATTVDEWYALTRLSMAEMIKNGITTCVEFNSYYPEELAEITRDMGMRCYIAPEVNSLKGCPYSPDGKTVVVEEEEKARAFDKLERNIRLIEKHDGTGNGRVRVTLGPTEPPACNPELLKEVRKYADTLKVPITMHAAETAWEVDFIRERYNKTPIEYVHANGCTGPDVILGHVIFTNESDIQILTRTGTNVAHCPMIFARRGNYLNSLQKYTDAGVNVGIGTDTFPQDIIQEMRLASICSKIADRSYLSAPSQLVFKCATGNGAKALRRDDLGSIRVGAKADLAVVNFDHLNMVPVRDPLKVLVSCGSGYNVDTTIVNGEILMQNKKFTTVSEETIVDQAWAAARKVWSNAKRLNQLSPLSIPKKQ